MGEAERKLVRPDLGGKRGEFGYAINSECAGKYRPDIKNPKTILFFESIQTTKNLAGNPIIIGKQGAKAITIDGTIVNL
jgi:hypothetical protein